MRWGEGGGPQLAIQLRQHGRDGGHAGHRILVEAKAIGQGAHQEVALGGIGDVDRAAAHAGDDAAVLEVQPRAADHDHVLLRQLVVQDPDELDAKALDLCAAHHGQAEALHARLDVAGGHGRGRLASPGLAPGRRRARQAQGDHQDDHQNGCEAAGPGRPGQAAGVARSVVNVHYRTPGRGRLAARLVECATPRLRFPFARATKKSLDGLATGGQTARPSPPPGAPNSLPGTLRRAPRRPLETP